LLLLPSNEFIDSASLEEFVTNDQSLRRELVVLEGEIAFQGSEDLARGQVEQVRLTERRVSLASSLGRRLVKMCPWVRLVAISGSAAYGRTKPDDDVDFFLVTCRNRLWVTFLAAMLTAKIYRAKNRASPVFCFNRLLEDDECVGSFRSPRDPLFVREALSLRIVDGKAYYHDLLLSASWMGQLFPALFDRAVSSVYASEPPSADKGNSLWSFINWIAYAILAPYLRMAGLWRNHRLQRAGNLDANFRTILRRGFFAYESRKYDLLRDRYREAFQ